eukprot:204855-Pyramimonas_sp.AAC.1
MSPRSPSAASSLLVPPTGGTLWNVRHQDPPSRRAHRCERSRVPRGEEVELRRVVDDVVGQLQQLG